MAYLVALDQGTTSSRTVIFNEALRLVASAQEEFAQSYPQAGWVEQDPADILRTQINTLRRALQKGKINPKEITAIGIANQRETTIVWDRTTGEPVYPAIVWQCRRTAPLCEALRQQGAEPFIRRKTGLVIDAYFSATKIRWILDNVPGARARAERGELLFGTVDTYLIWNMTAEKKHVTDITNASRTMLMNLQTLQWDDELLELLDIPRAMLPEILPNCAPFGTLRDDILGHPVSICAVAGDQHSALFGQGCFEDGDAKNTYGTGCFLLMKTGEKPIMSNNDMITTPAWYLGAGYKPQYALEGSIFIGGAAIQWLRDELGLIETAAQSEEIASQVQDSGGVFLVPAFTGLGAPWWDMYARGTLVGLTRGTNRAHIVRATLESIAYQSYDVLKSMESDTGMKLKKLRVDGGASQNDLLMQVQADILGVPVSRPRIIETTALGAAALAGLGSGLFRGLDDLAHIRRSGRTFRPTIRRREAHIRIRRWHEAVKRALAWEKPIE